MTPPTPSEVMADILETYTAWNGTDQDGNKLVSIKQIELAEIITALRARPPEGMVMLAKFGEWVLEELRGDNIGDDLDGGAAQDKAEEMGLLVRVRVTEPCGERCQCAEWDDFPQICLRRAAASSGGKEGKDG